ncbi:MAG: ribosome biogenesis GTPase Der [Gemmatimonadota bacterium]|nr:ribosome biogenesis GTPase Der [Gemmatimonadota bacterium]MDP6801851.1 ribosome biogenesis GTPase Der [Gemmatimonadota bacterium]MDP7031577.1 ribosome biogenesis GTPase Der [Gemmatimonadota bacterium]
MVSSAGMVHNEGRPVVTEEFAAGGLSEGISHGSASDRLPVVAIVGLPNVGKSTLFNRIVKSRLAVVDDQPGVTRDRNYAPAEWGGRGFWLVDTGGMTFEDGLGMDPAIQEQVELAIEEADLVVFVLDARVGATAEDEEAFRLLRRTGRRVLVAANKADDGEAAWDVASIDVGGVGEIVPISAMAGRGIGDFLDRVVAHLPPEEPSPEAIPGEVALAVVGRPNVGKSSLVNSLVGTRKMIVSEVAGTTRDAIDTIVERDGTRFRIIDTAGLRRRGRISRGVEYWSALRAMRALERCDVAAVLFDATEGITDQDVKIVGEAISRRKGIVLVMNKWDAVEKDHHVAERFAERVAWHFPFLEDAPLIHSSALTGRRVDRLLPEVARLAALRARRIPTAEVNRVIERLVAENPPPSGRSSRTTRILYATQVGASPPQFVVFVNRPKNLEGHYHRFLENRLKKDLGFTGVPVEVVLRQRKSRERDR